MKDDNITNNNSQRLITGTNIANDHVEDDDVDEDHLNDNSLGGSDENNER